MSVISQILNLKKCVVEIFISGDRFVFFYYEVVITQKDRHHLPAPPTKVKLKARVCGRFCNYRVYIIDKTHMLHKLVRLS